MKKRRYPKHLYPSKQYKKIVIDASLDDFVLLRYTKDNAPLKSNEKNLGLHLCASRFYNGCSVNLLSVYKKCDARYIVDGNASSPQHQEWKEGSSCYPLRLSDYKYQKTRGYIGVSIKNVHTVCIAKCEIKINGTKLRDDKVFFKIEHSPTKCNFWHFNIMIYGVNSITGKEYRLRDLVGFSSNQMKKIATALIHQLEKYLLRPFEMKRRYLPKSYYTKIG